ncbi:MAG: glycosyltransferase [Armatimonadetes bacterium]|nr:glycosyltransferase [Armatimonadota bacterium]
MGDPAPDGRVPTLSVIIPALNEAAALPATIQALHQSRHPLEIWVVDGGSTDGTPAVAAALGAEVLPVPRGRGGQLDAGARAARGEILWFLHADTLVPVDAAEQVRHALADPQVLGGSFRCRFLGSTWAARCFTRLYPVMQFLGCSYGDASLFLRRADYLRTGGFRSLPLFEDLEFWRRLRREGRLVFLPGPLATSARRFERHGPGRTLALWIGLHVLYFLGVPPERLERFYRSASPSCRSRKA